MIDQLSFSCGFCLQSLAEEYKHLMPNKIARCPRCRAYYLKVQAPEDQFHDQVMAVIRTAARTAGIDAENLQVVIRYGGGAGNELPQASFWDKDEILTVGEIAAVLNLTVDQVQILLNQGLIETRMPAAGGRGARRGAVQKYRIIGGEA